MMKSSIKVQLGDQLGDNIQQGWLCPPRFPKCSEAVANTQWSVIKMQGLKNRG